MTYDDIMRALECCTKKLCTECPRGNNNEHVALCQENLIRCTLGFLLRIHSDMKKAISEVFKEFAEMLKEKSEPDMLTAYVDIDDIDNLVKEMEAKQ